MKWCCVGFKSAYEAAGERSIAVLVDYDYRNEPEFILQARAFDGIVSPAIKPPAPMSLVIEVGMQFCPWCGVALRKWYGKHISELSRPQLRIQREQVTARPGLIGRQDE